MNSYVELGTSQNLLLHRLHKVEVQQRRRPLWKRHNIMMNLFAVSLRRAAPSSICRSGASSSNIAARFSGAAATTPSSRPQDGNENEIDHFRILGFERTFTIPMNELKAKYKHLMKDLHPDRYATASKEVSAQKGAMATDVTRAYGVVGDPLLRSLHLLELHGTPIEEMNDQSIIDHALLFEVMEIREQIEDSSTDEELRPILQSSIKKKDELIGQLAEAFGEGRVEDAKRITAKLQYWARIEETIVDKMTSVHKQ